MAISPELETTQRSPGILLIPLLAIAFGAAAVLLTGGVDVGPAGTPVGGTGGGLLHSVTYEEAGFVAVVLLGGWVLYSAYQRIRGNALSLPVHFVLSALVAFAVAIAFIVVVHLFVHGATVPGGVPGTGTPGGGGTPNSTSPTIPPSSTNATGTGNAPGIQYPSGWPWWTPYVVLGVLGGAIGAFVVPMAMTRSRSAGGGRGVAASPSAASAIGSAISTLDRYRGNDPRPTIIALYGDLLRAVGHRAGPIEPKTARELSEELVAGLGVSRSTAQELTDRFEEARYSTRPLGPEAVARTRAALAEALQDLARARPPS